MFRSIRTLIPLVLVVMGLAHAVVAAAATPPPNVESARLDAYAKPSGETYFAFSLMPQEQLPPAESADVVVLLTLRPARSARIAKKRSKFCVDCWRRSANMTVSSWLPSI